MQNISGASHTSKVAAVTAGFWLIKIAATTLGETAGDAVSMSMNLGYAVGTGIFTMLFFAVVIAQIRATAYHPLLYWSVIVTTTTVGTTMADFADRSLGIGYMGGSLILFACVLAILALWRASTGSVSVQHINTPKIEAFYWLTILFSNTLGTALGDFMADSSGLGYAGSAVVFAASLVVIAGAYYCTTISRTFLFWAAFILTRPLGATLGDILTKTTDKGGLDLSRYTSSAALMLCMLACILLTTRKKSA